MHHFLSVPPFLTSFSFLSSPLSPPCSKHCHHVLSSSSSLSLLFSVRVGSVSDSVQRPSRLRTNSEDHGSLKTKEQSPNPDKDKGARKKSSDSGEEADKDFILIWVRHIHSKKPVNKPHMFSFRKATKGEYNQYIYIRGCTRRFCLTAKIQIMFGL